MSYLAFIAVENKSPQRRARTRSATARAARVDALDCLNPAFTSREAGLRCRPVAVGETGDRRFRHIIGLHAFRAELVEPDLGVELLEAQS
jgi:hypothetical protein